MQLLVDFLCRFGFGLALGLVLTPAALVPPGFFRVNSLVVMGLSTLAALASPGILPPGSWLLPAAAALATWVGSVAFLAGRARAGQAACAIAGLALAAATAIAADSPAAAAGGLVSGAVVGLAVHAMLLGHWYLNAPGMRVDVLARMIDVALVAWALALVLAAAGVALGGWPGGVGTSPTATSLVWLRWLAGLVGLPVLLWMSRETLRIPNTQSATGILYVACLAAIVGELAGQLLAARA